MLRWLYSKGIDPTEDFDVVMGRLAKFEAIGVPQIWVVGFR
jgi:hypothetical protein